MTRFLYGKPVAEKIKNEMLLEIQRRKAAGIQPKLAILRVGNRQDDIAYEERVIKNCSEIGMASVVHVVDYNIIMEDFEMLMADLNADRTLHGILMFRPLPEHLDAARMSRIIDPLKDIDCMSPVNAEKIFEGDNTALLPCTPAAVIEILKFYGYALEGSDIAIVNRSMVLGRPLAMLLLNENATVTICHSKSADLESITSKSDIVVTGVGRGKFFKAAHFSEKSVIIDAGINFIEGRLCGDVDEDEATGLAAALTPVPGGVGVVTSMMLLKNTLKAIELQLDGPAGGRQ